MPLNVIIVGAGLAGLGAAIALHQAGHNVQIFEKSGFQNETGAAILVAPNATRVLREWGCDLSKLRAVHCTRLQLWNSKGQRLKTAVVTKQLQDKLGIPDNWNLVHRVDLHNTLRAATAQSFEGKDIKIRLLSQVVSVDSEAGIVTLADGTVHRGDLIIGADGTHSRTVHEVIGEGRGKQSTGQNCFRFLVPVKKAQANPLTAKLLSHTGLDAINAFSSIDRRLVMYPCRDGTLINVGAIHPAGSEQDEESWLKSGSLSELLNTYSSFSPELVELCRLAEDLKLWSLASRCPPPTFTKGKLALVGDAAHPTLPHQGQGGAQALEDAAALGALFTKTTRADQVSDRLKLYNKIRYKHAVTVMMMSRVPEERRMEILDELRQYVPDAEYPSDMFSFTWGANPTRAAEKLLDLI